MKLLPFAFICTILFSAHTFANTEDAELRKLFEETATVRTSVHKTKSAFWTKLQNDQSGDTMQEIADSYKPEFEQLIQEARQVYEKIADQQPKHACVMASFFTLEGEFLNQLIPQHDPCPAIREHLDTLAHIGKSIPMVNRHFLMLIKRITIGEIFEQQTNERSAALETAIPHVRSAEAAKAIAKEHTPQIAWMFDSTASLYKSLRSAVPMFECDIEADPEKSSPQTHINTSSHEPCPTIVKNLDRASLIMWTSTQQQLRIEALVKKLADQ